MACHRWFSYEKAANDLGYIPIVSLDEGIERTALYFLEILAQQEKLQKKETKKIEYIDQSTIQNVHSIQSIQKQNQLTSVL